MIEQVDLYFKPFLPWSTKTRIDQCGNRCADRSLLTSISICALIIDRSYVQMIYTFIDQAKIRPMRKSTNELINHAPIGVRIDLYPDRMLKLICASFHVLYRWICLLISTSMDCPRTYESYTWVYYWSKIKIDLRIDFCTAQSVYPSEYW